MKRAFNNKLKSKLIFIFKTKKLNEKKLYNITLKYYQ